MRYIQIDIPKARIILTENEVLQMLKQDTELFATSLKRGKSFIRTAKQRAREEKKFLEEGTR